MKKVCRFAKMKSKSRTLYINCHILYLWFYKEMNSMQDNFNEAWWYIYKKLILHVFNSFKIIDKIHLFYAKFIFNRIKEYI